MSQRDNNVGWNKEITSLVNIEIENYWAIWVLSDKLLLIWFKLYKDCCCKLKVVLHTKIKVKSVQWNKIMNWTKMKHLKVTAVPGSSHRATLTATTSSLSPARTTPRWARSRFSIWITRSGEPDPSCRSGFRSRPWSKIEPAGLFSLEDIRVKLKRLF